MTNDIFIWNVGDDISIDLLVVSPATGLGLAGKTANIDMKIRRYSDSKYWTGTAWSSTVSSITVSEVDATNEPGRYSYILSGSSGNTTADRYFVYASIDDQPTVQGASVEIHVSRDLSVKVYESEPL